MQKKNKNIQIVIIAAGAGTRFKKEGFLEDKPFILVNKKMIIEYAIESFLDYENKIVVFLKEFLNKYPNQIEYLKNKYKIRLVFIDKLTKGAAETASLVENIVCKNRALLIADSDNFYINNQTSFFIEKALKMKENQANLSVFENNLPLFSYIKIKNNLVVKTVEKQVVSNLAISGMYFFKKAKFFFRAFRIMKKNNLKINNEFYLSNIYNILINKFKQKVGFYKIQNQNYKSLGTPLQVKEYLKEIDNEI